MTGGCKIWLTLSVPNRIFVSNHEKCTSARMQKQETTSWTNSHINWQWYKQARVYLPKVNVCEILKLVAHFVDI